MGHKILLNINKTPIEHPLTGQLIPGGHCYTVPDEDELKVQEKGMKAWEKAQAKAVATDDTKEQNPQSAELKSTDDSSKGNDTGSDSQ